MENSHGLMVRYMKDNTVRVYVKERENIFLRIIVSMRAIGRMAYNRVMVYFVKASTK